MEKLKESAFSVLPVSFLVLILTISGLVTLTAGEIIAFCLCSVALIIGMALFTMGSDIAMTPMGQYMGSSLVKSKKLLLLVLSAFFIGLLVTIAEPDLNVLAGQVSAVINETMLIIFVGLGVGFFLTVAVLKIVFNKSLSQLLMLFYLFLFALCALLLEMGKGSFAPLAFDSGGVTTGPITVPFIMAFGVGLASAIGGKHSGENSFGLVALCSIGPILAVMVLVLGSDGSLVYEPADYSMEAVLSAGVWTVFLKMMGEVVVSLALVLGFFLILNTFVLHLPVKRLLPIFKGLLLTFLGLVIFLGSANIGFMPIGFNIGSQLSSLGEKYIVTFGFIIGLVVVLAEPAVHVLKSQVENITGGIVTGRSLMIALSIGVGISIGLSMLRIAIGFSILYYLIPGYLLSMALSIFVPKIYTAIAFDSGGVASGPMTSTFILPIAIGTCVTLSGVDSVLELGFGIVAMVAMTPLITIQLLGFKAIVKRIVRRRIAMKRIMRLDDEQIIDF